MQPDTIPAGGKSTPGRLLEAVGDDEPALGDVGGVFFRVVSGKLEQQAKFFPNGYETDTSTSRP